MLFFTKRHPTLAAEMRLLMHYFSVFDGENSWDEVIRPVAERTFHDDLVVYEEGATYNKEQFMEKLKAFVQEKGGSMQVHKLKEQVNGIGIQYQVTFVSKNASSRNSSNGASSSSSSSSFTTKSLGTFKDGKLVSVQRDHVRKPNTIL